MIAKGHFHGPPAIPTLIAKGYLDARPGRQFTRRISFDYHGKNRGGIERSADYPLSAERFHLWSPDLWSRANGLESALTFIERGSEMKALWCGAATLALAAAVSLSPAMAQGPKPAGGNTWPSLSQRLVHGTSTAPASPAMLRARVNGLNVAPGILDLAVDPGAIPATTVPHYELQYHYAGRHAHWEKHLILVEPPDPHRSGSYIDASVVAADRWLPRGFHGPVRC
jgi:hypothetical protein